MKNCVGSRSEGYTIPLWSSVTVPGVSGSRAASVEKPEKLSSSKPFLEHANALRRRRIAALVFARGARCRERAETRARDRVGLDLLEASPRRGISGIAVLGHGVAKIGDPW
jgi:hypothetical protein